MPKKLGEMLIDGGLLEPPQLDAALDAQERSDLPLGATLVRMGLVAEEALVATLANQLRLPVASLRDWQVHPDLLDLVPLELAEKHRVLPLSVREDGKKRLLYLAVADPSDLASIEAVSQRTGMDVRMVLVAPSELEQALYRSYLGPAYPDEPSPFDRASESAEAAARRSERWSVSREELFALFSDAGAPPDDAAGSAPATEGGFAQRRLDELDAIVGALAELLLERGVLERADLVAQLRTRLAQGPPAERLDGEAAGDASPPPDA
jgi:hypothetical protein